MLLYSKYWKIGWSQIPLLLVPKFDFNFSKQQSDHPVKNGWSHMTVTGFKAAQDSLPRSGKDSKRKLTWRHMEKNQQHHWEWDGSFKQMGIEGKWEKSIQKAKSWNHLDGTNEEDVKDVYVVNDAEKYKGKGCLEKRWSGSLITLQRHWSNSSWLSAGLQQ